MGQFRGNDTQLGKKSGMSGRVLGLFRLYTKFFRYFCGKCGGFRSLRRAIFWVYWVETRVGHRVSSGELRALRSAPQGSALRTRGLLKKAGENFISPAGGSFFLVRCVRRELFPKCILFRGQICYNESIHGQPLCPLFSRRNVFYAELYILCAHQGHFWPRC